MDFSETDIERLKTLHDFLSNSFKGAYIGALKVDELTEALKRAIEHIESE